MSEELPRLPGFREAALRRRRETVSALADHRRAAGLSQTEIAARMGTSQSTVARLEAGDVDPRMSTLERYAEALGGRLDVALRFDAPGLPYLRPAANPVAYPVAPERGSPVPGVPVPGVPVPGVPGPGVPGPGVPGPGVPLRPAARLGSEPDDPAPTSPAPERPYAAPVPPPGGDRPARPSRRW
ncbi:helix-turn-helix domain-containing protein [Cryptosporangium arvum]|uniref:helix-turn-helix domain-containing protein n=1 Tax=Cryptosporangium arvum TaxID=80871 RepID=UPI0004BC7282|nr:helix-turn-helix transcriptional regulator [Cryptosporangium arvum]